MPDNARVYRNFSGLVVGLAIAAAGILFTLDNMRVIYAEDYFSYWPLILIVIGVVHFGQSGTWGGRVWGTVLIIGGAWLLAENLGWVSMSVWTLSPLLLVLLGITIIWRAMHTPAMAGPPTDSSSFIKGTAVMGGFERTSETADFRGGDLMAVMAGCKLDLRRATISGNEAVIDVLAIMGGMELRVPENWKVEPHVLPIFGGVADHTRSQGSGPLQRLVVRGTVFMGGVEIKN